MAKLMFVNLPVADLAKSTAFYEALGGTRNPQFSDDTATCIVLSDVLHVMLLTHAKFSSFTAKPIADAHATCGVLLCTSADSREDVNATVDRAAAAGGKADPAAPQDYGFMFNRSVEDPDGHTWEIMWMDMAGMQEAMGGSEAVPA